jgi:hypothetical protein
MSRACKHEAPPYPEETLVVYVADNPLPIQGPPRIVPCLYCGAPLDRGHYNRMISVPDLFNEHTWPYGREG